MSKSIWNTPAATNTRAALQEFEAEPLTEESLYTRILEIGRLGGSSFTIFDPSEEEKRVFGKVIETERFFGYVLDKKAEIRWLDVEGPEFIGSIIDVAEAFKKKLTNK